MKIVRIMFKVVLEVLPNWQGQNGLGSKMPHFLKVKDKVLNTKLIADTDIVSY